MVGIRSPICLVVGSCTRHPGVLGSIPKREEPGKTGAPCVELPGSSRVPVINTHTPKYDRRQRPCNSKEFWIGVSQGDLSHDLRRGRQSSPWIALWALWMIQLPRPLSHKVTKCKCVAARADTAGAAAECAAKMAGSQTTNLWSWQALNALVQQHENTGGGRLTLWASWSLELKWRTLVRRLFVVYKFHWFRFGILSTQSMLMHTPSSPLSSSN